LVGDTTFYSITYRAFKLPQLETLCEDYGARPMRWPMWRHYAVDRPWPWML